MNTLQEMISLLVLSLLVYNGLSISLDGEWTGSLKDCRGSNSEDCMNEISFPVDVPGGVYTDLVKQGIIPDNFIGDNDLAHRWIGNESYVCSRQFNVDETLLRARRLLLVFHGLDTFASIYVNEQKIGETSNMFLRYDFDVKEYVKVGSNSLRVVFSSAVKTARSLFEKQAKEYEVPPVCVPKEYNGVCHVNHIRKMQASFAWDWGPGFPSMGIWKNVELLPVDDFAILDVVTDIQEEEETWKIIATVLMHSTRTVDGSTSSPCRLTAELFLKNDTVFGAATGTLERDKETTVESITLHVQKDLVETWWPNGYGDQPLYKLSIGVSTSETSSSKDIRIGFRTVELVEDPLDKGRSFYFRINGVPIFAKGSNFIPASVFPEYGANESTITHLLKSSKDAHMNMLRVWGGGVYESQLFYNLADEYGIMIWQDFMFACGMYPTTNEFLESVREEVKQNVNRLKNHPSIVLWAGNNENEAALYGNWYGTGNKKIYPEDYLKLYVDLIKEEVEKLDKTRPFVVSSPGNGIEYSKEYNYVGKNPYSTLYGDVHYYNYIKNGWDPNQYPRARFSSEYGFQSLPSIYTLAPPASNRRESLQIESEFMKHRQHLPLGTAYMKGLISRNFAMPQSNDTFKDFVDTIYLSQVNQAQSVKVQTEFYRRSMTELNEIGEGKTMGALYWQLNDVWQAPSWSSIDFEGRWKMLHYYAVDFFSPIIVTSHLSSARTLSLHIVSDKLTSTNDVTLEVDVYRWDSFVPVHRTSYKNLTIEGNKATKLDQYWLDEFLSSINCGSLATARKQCVMKLTLKGKDGTQIAPTNYVYPDTIKEVDLPSANVSVTVKELPGESPKASIYEIEVSTDKIALFVWLESGQIPGRFTENGFHMFDTKKKLFFHTAGPTTKKLSDVITVRTISDVYNHGRTEYFERILSILRVI